MYSFTESIAMVMGDSYPVFPLYRIVATWTVELHVYESKVCFVFLQYT